MQKLIALLALCIATTTFADLGRGQPVTGGPTTGGASTGGNAPGSNQPVPGGATTGGPTTGGASTGGNAPGSNPTGGAVTGGNVGGNVGVNVGEERRYIVEFDNFIVLDETGCDLCGSDEVHFGIRTEDYALLSP